MKNVLPHGTWPSSLSVEILATSSARFGEPKISGDAVLWAQSIAEEKGRMGLFVWREGAVSCVLPSPYDARSKAHEYGGGAFAVSDDLVYFVNSSDQQIYCFNWQVASSPKPLTHAPLCRFADLQIIASQNRLIAVCEDHVHAEPKASIVSICVKTGEHNTLASGADFYAGLCISPCGQKVAAVQWHHPNMPWDVTELIECDLSAGTSRVVIDQRESCSNIQPSYSPSGELYCVSDKSDWWNVIHAESQRLVFEAPMECATPQWVFGMQNWGFLDEDTIVISGTQDGAWQLHKCCITTGQLDELCFEETNTHFNSFSHVHCANGRFTCIAASPLHGPRPILVTPENSCIDLLSPPSPLSNDDISQPKSLWFPTTDATNVHLWYYPPTNSRYQASDDSAPPLIVLGHGGPTGAADTALNLKIQYWTQRGFAVADVNYRGSTGFGREYRNRLKGQWGVFDVEDLCTAAEFLVAAGLANPNQKIIKGSSAGGYSVLAALTQHQTFNAGVSLYGVADLEALAKHTHKFEAHYLDSLIGPYPEAIESYKTRSPINNMAGLNCPIFVAQGADDKVVPPEQADMIVEAAKRLGVSVHYCLFEGEGHGFRQAETLKQLFAAEWQFYCETFALGSEPR